MRISVALASYNGEKYIEDQILSLLAVLTPDDEIVVSDDNSTDSTRKVVELISDSRIKLLPAGPRLGYQKNFERAIKASKGEFIFFSDQDDICLPTRIEKSLLALRSKAVVAGNAMVVDAELKPLNNLYFSQRNAKNFSATSLFIRPKIIGATMAARRDFINFALPFPRRVPHDQWLSTLAAMHNQLVVFDECFIKYRRHENVVTHWGESRRRSLFVIIIERMRLGTILILSLIFRRLKSAVRKGNSCAA